MLAAVLLVLVSGYAALLALTAQDAPASAEVRSETLLMSIVLGAVSGAGIVAAFRPSRCMGFLRLQGKAAPTQDVSGASDSHASFPRVAHHCSCGRFADHTLRVGGQTVCAGCLGMAAGGAFGIGVALASAAGLLVLDRGAGVATILLGAAMAAAGLALLYRRSPPGVHAAANFALVSGAAILAALLSTQGIVAGAFGLLAALALVGLRIEMSRWRHLSLYAECPWRDTCRGSSAPDPA